MSDLLCPDNSSDVCTLATCSIKCTQLNFVPTLGGNAAYAAILGLILVAQIGLGIRYKTWGFMAGMISGLLLEVIGYVGRVMLHSSPFDFNDFLIYLIPLTIGPAFLSGAIYLCLARIIVAYGTGISRLSPRTYTITFMCSDFTALVLQGAGGGLAATSNTPGDNTGRNIMIAGLIFQVVSLLIFLSLWTDFIFSVRKAGEAAKDDNFAVVRNSRKFKLFQYALWAATILIFIRSTFRIVELWGGFSGAVASNEVVFMILEGPMIILATLLLTVLHPGIAFSGGWGAAGWSLKKKSNSDRDGIALRFEPKNSGDSS